MRTHRERCSYGFVCVVGRSLEWIKRYIDVVMKNDGGQGRTEKSVSEDLRDTLYYSRGFEL